MGKTKIKFREEKNMSCEFESWLTGKLTEFNADAEVFSSYILGILESDEKEDEKVTNLQDLLEGLGLDDGQPDACRRVEKEIWTHWTKKNDDDAKNGSEVEKPKILADLGATVVAHAESQTQAYKAKGTSSSSREDKDKEAIKAAILAQYNNVVEGDESEGDEEEDEEEFGKNTNAETVAKAAVEQRERCRIAAAEKKEKDKSDREKQKKDAEDRNKKAQEKAAKGERKR